MCCNALMVCTFLYQMECEDASSQPGAKTVVVNHSLFQGFNFLSTVTDCSPPTLYVGSLQRTSEEGAEDVGNSPNLQTASSTEVGSPSRGYGKATFMSGALRQPMFPVALYCVVAVISVATSLNAEERQGDEARARALFAQGIAAAAAGDDETAVRAFSQSYDLFPHPGTLVNLATCQDRLGRLADAYRSWTELLSRYGTVVSTTARGQARGRVAALDALLATVEVTSRPEGALLQIDGREVGRTPLDGPLRLDPGPHVFMARFEGDQDVTEGRVLNAGQNPAVALAQEAETPALGSLIVECPVEGATVTIDDRPPVPAPARQEVEAGEHQVRVVASGYRSYTEIAVVASGDESRLLVDLELAETEETPTSTSERRGFWRGPWPWIIGGVILAGAGAAVIGVAASGDEEPNADWRMSVP